MTVKPDPKLPFLRDASAARRYDICTVQELLGHSGVETTMMYTHVLNRGPSGVRSRLSLSAYRHRLCLLNGKLYGL